MSRPVVLVTGTSSGIGREAVLHLARRATVVATARNVDTIQDLASKNVSVYPLDVTDEASIQAAVAHTLEHFGRIDAIVNNAGFGAFMPVEQTSLAAFQAMLDVNLLGAHRLTQEVLPHMRNQGHGRIVNVSSIAGHIGFPMIGAYSATKFALRGLSQAMAAELRPFGIHVSLIEPGSIRTSFGARAEQEQEVAGLGGSEGPYANLYRRFDKLVGGKGRAHPRVIAKRINHACLSRRPRFHYLAPLDAKAGNVLKRVLPDGLINFVMGRAFKP